MVTFDGNKKGRFAGISWRFIITTEALHLQIQKLPVGWQCVCYATQPSRVSSCQASKTHNLASSIKATSRVNINTITSHYPKVANPKLGSKVELGKYAGEWRSVILVLHRLLPWMCSGPDRSFHQPAPAASHLRNRSLYRTTSKPLFTSETSDTNHSCTCLIKCCLLSITAKANTGFFYFSRFQVLKKLHLCLGKYFSRHGSPE